MFHITALDLEHWAERITASSEFPRLLSKLVHASAEQLSRLDMPGGELTRLSGFDGIVECVNGDDMVPPGLSVWELSVEKNIDRKAETDYVKRREGPLDQDVSAAAFVFATPRRWPSAEDWATEKRGNNRWRNVRVLWSQHLEQWLSRVPWVAAEFAPVIRNSPIAGIESLGMIWTDYASIALRGVDALDPSFVIADRPGAGTSFVQWLTATLDIDDQIIRVAGPSEREVLHYLAATIRTLPLAQMDRFESTIFSVYNKEMALSLGAVGPHHVILVRVGDALPHVIAAARRCGCRVAIIQSQGAENPAELAIRPKLLKLEPISRSALVSSLIGLGCDEEYAAQACAQCDYNYERIRAEIMLY